MKKILRVIAIVFFLILIYAIFFIDNESSLSLKIDFSKQDPKKIYPYLNDFRKWQEWSVWSSNSYSNISDMKYLENGKVLINSNESFSLKMKIISEKENKKVEIEYFSYDELVAKSKIFLSKEDSKTFLNWNYFADYSSSTKWNPLKKYVILFMNRKLTAVYHQSFLSLKKKLLEKDNKYF